jgi:acetyl esterase/lipase
MAVVLRSLAITSGWLLLVPFALLVFAALFPVIPWLRLYAGSFMPNHAPWLLPPIMIAGALGVLAGRLRPSRAASILIAFSVVTALGAVIILVRLIHTADTHGARIALSAAFSLRTIAEGAGPDETQIYASPGGEPLSLDIYHPPSWSKQPLLPVIVDVHGGGFVEGSRHAAVANMRWLADQGWLVLSIDYRLARPDRPTWNLAAADVGCALTWLKANAIDLHADMSRVTLRGRSAGGHLAINTAYAAARGQAASSCGGDVPRIAAVVAYVPIVDFSASWAYPAEMKEVGRSYLRAYLGGTLEQVPDRYRAMSSINRIAAGAPPTLLIGADADGLLPPDALRAFARRLDGAGVPEQLMLVPYANHDFNVAYDGIGNQAARQMTEHFLTVHGQRP